MELKVKADPRLENLRRAREAKRLKREAQKPEPHEGNGTLLEPSFELDRFQEMLHNLTVDFLSKNFNEQILRDICESMRDAYDRCNKRLQILETQRTAMLCDHCKKVLPGGRFAGEIVIRDELTNELKALRACGEPCYREISRMANERRAKHQGSIRGTVAM
jgi:hypothetical protein